MLSGFHVWLAILGLYVLESLRLTTIGATVFRRNIFSRRWRASSPIAFPERKRWAWTFETLLPAGHPVIVCQNHVIAYGGESIAPNSAFAWSPRAAVRYDEIAAVSTEDRTLQVNGSFYLRFETAKHAALAMRDILAMKALGTERRRARIRENVHSALRARVRQEWQQMLSASRWIRILAAAQWVIAFVLFPVALLWTGDLAVLPFLLLFWMFALMIAAVYPGARKVASPDRTGFPWKSILFVIYPISALRAVEDLAEGFAAGAHPLALCLELCEGAHRDSLAARLYLETRYPVPIGDFPDGCLADTDMVTRGFNELTANAIEELLIPVARNLTTPARKDEGCDFYCPRCLTQFVRGIEYCPDCANIRVQTFADPVSAK